MENQRDTPSFFDVSVWNGLGIKKKIRQCKNNIIFPIDILGKMMYNYLRIHIKVV